MLKAIHFSDFEEFRAERDAGSFYAAPEGSRGDWVFWYCCPCGCGVIAPLSVGANFKPPSSPSWNWNVSKSEPTLSPSVNHKGHWHGWLRDGYWTSV